MAVRKLKMAADKTRLNKLGVF